MAARRRQGLKTPGEGDEGGGASGVGLSPSQGNALGMGLRVGIELVSALVVAVAIGWALDGWLGTRPFLLMLFFVLGGAAGVANVWRLVSPPKAPRPDHNG
jgi:ATP synthase protein I